MPGFPTDTDLQKVARRHRRKARPVKPNRREEARLRRAVSDLWKSVLWPATERIKQLVQQKASPAAIAREIEEALYLANTTYSRAAKNIIDSWMLGVDREVSIAIQRSMHQALGIDVTSVLQRPDVAEALQTAGLRAANLITSIPQEYLGRVAQAVADNFSGVDLPEGRTLLQQIQHIGGVSYKRAKLISRDQTSKLTAQLNQTRQQAVGIEIYRWRTVHDERVVGNPVGISPTGNSKHGDHYHMDGKLFRWDDNTVYSDDDGTTWKSRPKEWSQNVPGWDIQCRCWAEPEVDAGHVVEMIQEQRAGYLL
ncbi:MAG: hypothetical protein A2Y38_12360 [Spirochaetes bacterium GWB1_59_5]|nr:MAG: hypothetical protein A2Y38_12360 [Spirochaetes bacterium GWB1_59_5]